MLKHPVVFAQKDSYYEFYKGFNSQDNKTFSFWCDAISSISESLPTESEQLKFKGDNLEVLSEIFFNCFHADEAVGLREYTPTPLDEDYGVDATGINPAGTRCAVQCKFKSFQPVLYEELAKTFASGFLNMNCEVTKPNSIYVFTNSMTHTNAIDKVLGNRVRFIDYNVIVRKIDNNHTFWQYAYDEIFNTLNQ